MTKRNESLAVREIKGALDLQAVKMTGHIVFKQVQYYSYNYSAEIMNSKLVIQRKNRNVAGADLEVFLTLEDVHVKGGQDLEKTFRSLVQAAARNMKQLSIETLTQKLWNRYVPIIDNYHLAWELVNDLYTERQQRINVEMKQEDKEDRVEQEKQEALREAQEDMKKAIEEANFEANKVEVSKYDVRLVKEQVYEYETSRINSSRSAANFINQTLQLDRRGQEVFAMVTLDVKHNITGVFEVTTGGLSSSIAHPREIFQRAVLQGAGAIIVFHNHPSGDPTPSTADKQVTDKLAKAGRVLGIDLLDHIIIGDDCYVSFKQKGAL